MLLGLQKSTSLQNSESSSTTLESQQQIALTNAVKEQESFIQTNTSNDEIKDEEPVLPEEVDEVEDNKDKKIDIINIKTEELKSKISLTKDIINTSTDLNSINNAYTDFKNYLGDYNIPIPQDILDEINDIDSKYLNIKTIDSFINDSKILDSEEKNIDDINRLREESKDLDNLIDGLENIELKSMFVSELMPINKVLLDTTKPNINILDNQIYEDEVSLNIEDETNTKVYLNDSLISDYKIKEEGNYRLKVVDEALNEVNISFSIKKPEPILEVVSEDNSFSKPMKNYYITQGFSGKNGHMGIDFGSYNKLESIYPVAKGTVIYVGKDKYGANVVKIKHNINGKELFSTYAHMRDVYLHVGQEVSKNDVLGLMGSTGWSTGPHLHLEMTTCDWTYNCNYNQYKNNLVNPIDYI